MKSPLVPEHVAGSVRSWIGNHTERLLGEEDAVLCDYIFAVVNKGYNDIRAHEAACSDLLKEFLKDDAQSFTRNLFKMVEAETGTSSDDTQSADKNRIRDRLAALDDEENDDDDDDRGHKRSRRYNDDDDAKEEAADEYNPLSPPQRVTSKRPVGDTSKSTESRGYSNRDSTRSHSDTSSYRDRGDRAGLSNDRERRGGRRERERGSGTDYRDHRDRDNNRDQDRDRHPRNFRDGSYNRRDDREGRDGRDGGGRPKPRGSEGEGSSIDSRHSSGRPAPPMSRLPPGAYPYGVGSNQQSGTWFPGRSGSGVAGAPPPGARNNARPLPIPSLSMPPQPILPGGVSPVHLVGVPPLGPNVSRGPFQPRGGYRGGHRGGRGGGVGPRNQRDQRGPGGFSARPAKLHATIIVKQLPPEYNTIEKMNTHFQSFGTIVNVKVNIGQGRNSALVQFSCEAEAQTALKDPKPLFDNRHITVESATEQDDETHSIATVDQAKAQSGYSYGQTNGAGKGEGAVRGRPPKVRIHQAPEAYSYRKPSEVEAKTKVMLKQREKIVDMIKALKAQGKSTEDAEKLLESVDKMMGTLFKDAKPPTPKAEVRTIRLENVGDQLTLDLLSTHFHKFGQGATVTAVEGHLGRYLVEFTERRFAAAAVKHGGSIDGVQLLMFWHNPESTL